MKLQLQLIRTMEPIKQVKNPWVLAVRSVTWYKNSHSLFDYESNKISTLQTVFPANSTSGVALYRKRQACEVICFDEKEQALFDSEEYQFLTKFRVDQASSNKFLLQFFSEPAAKSKEVSSQRIKTEQSKSADPKQEETYIIVRKQKDFNGDPKGYKLDAGQTIRLGRVEFFVSEVCVDGKVSTPFAMREKFNLNGTVFKYKKLQKKEDEQKSSCKICLEDVDEEDDFLFNPCKCAGSCGTVHLNCLLQWISIKVKKEVVGGTLHYNFEKFECEVCKAELPTRVETENRKIIQLLPIEKPKGNYVILEGACEKTKSVMMVQNVPVDGIKFGRGHECEIRITDISVSRNHALIKFQNGAFHVFDNKSKFGTLIKDERMEATVTPDHPQALQIGRTVVIVQLRKESDIVKERAKASRSNGEKIELKYIESKKVLDKK